VIDPDDFLNSKSGKLHSKQTLIRVMYLIRFVRFSSIKHPPVSGESVKIRSNRQDRKNVRKTVSWPVVAINKRELSF